MDEPLLEFGGPGEFSDVRQGLREAGPFDLRFGAGRNEMITVGLVGPDQMIEATQKWLNRCADFIPGAADITQYPAYPGFDEVFRAKMVTDARFVRSLGGESGDLAAALREGDAKVRFESVLDLYSEVGQVVENHLASKRTRHSSTSRSRHHRANETVDCSEPQDHRS